MSSKVRLVRTENTYNKIIDKYLWYKVDEMQYEPNGDDDEAGDSSKLHPAVSTVPPPVTSEWQSENQDRQSLVFTKASAMQLQLQWEIRWLRSHYCVTGILIE